MSTIGSYEAKTHLPRLLDEVAAGATVTITKHGREVARLVPVSGGDGTPAQVVEAIKAERKGVRLRGLSVRRMAAEGRR